MAILEWEEEERVVLVAISQQSASDLPDQPYLINRFFSMFNFRLKKYQIADFTKKNTKNIRHCTKVPLNYHRLSHFPLSLSLPPLPFTLPIIFLTRISVI